MIDLKHGDCLELMKEITSGSVDMVLTDPPYGMNFQSNQRKNKHEVIENDNNLEWIFDFVSESYRVSSDNSAHYVFCSWHNVDIFKQELQKKFKIKNILTWVKNNTSMGDLKGDFAPRTEFILFFHKGRQLIRGGRDSNVLEFRRTKNEYHPTQKPVDMLEYMIEKFSDVDSLILDPFMGSGSTGVACVNTNRKFIGIEKYDKYFEIAEKRIKDAQCSKT